MTRPTPVPQPKPRHYHISSVDQSVMELQRTYPDLAFRGRPLLPDQPHKAHLVTEDVADGTAVLSSTNLTKENKAFSPIVFSGDDSCNDQNTTGVTAPSDTSKNLGENRPDANHLSGPQAISLHITLRTGAKAESNTRIHPTTESSDDTHGKSSKKHAHVHKFSHSRCNYCNMVFRLPNKLSRE